MKLEKGRKFNDILQNKRFYESLHRFLMCWNEGLRYLTKVYVSQASTGEVDRMLGKAKLYGVEQSYIKQSVKVMDISTRSESKGAVVS